MPKIDPQQLQNNPFAVPLKIPVNKVVSNRSLTRDKEGLMLPSVYHTERVTATKIYHNAGARKQVNELSPGAKALYLHILLSLDSGVDYVTINVKIYMAETGIKSLTTVAEAKKELIRELFISPTIFKTTYWINPYKFFCGSRVNKYPSAVEVKHVWEQ